MATLFVVTSWLEGPRVTSEDPWDIVDHPSVAREREWFRDERLPMKADGGEQTAGD